MRISDWSSDVCSSDLTFGRLEDHGVAAGNGHRGHHQRNHHREIEGGYAAHDPDRLADREGIDPAANIAGIFALCDLSGIRGELHRLKRATDLAFRIRD